MKKILTYLLIISLNLLTFTLIAQKSKRKPTNNNIKKEKVDSKNDINSANENTSDIFYVYDDRENNGTIKKRLNDKFELIQKNNNSISTYGLLKNGKPHLPVIFGKGFYKNDTDGYLLFGLNNYVGLYCIESENWSIPLKYNNLYYIGSELFAAKYFNNFGIIDKNDNKIVDFQYSRISEIINFPKYYILSTNNSQIYNNNLLYHLYGIYSVEKKDFVVPPIYTYLDKLGYNIQLFVVCKDSKYNICDINNNIRFKNWYDEHISLSHNNNIIVRLNGLMGIIDINENFIVPIEYRFISKNTKLNGSLSAIDRNGKYGYITIDGKIDLPFIYDFLYEIDNYILSKRDGKFGIIKSINGGLVEILPCEFDTIFDTRSGFLAKRKGQYSLFNNLGKAIDMTMYSNLNILFPIGGAFNKLPLLVANIKDDYYILNLFGEKVSQTSYNLIEPLYNLDPNRSYDNEFNYSYLKIKKNGKYGVLSQFGIEIIEPILDEIISIYDKDVIIQNGNKLGIYNIQNKKNKVDFEYDQILIGKKNFILFKNNDLFEVGFNKDSKIEPMK